MYDIRPSSAYIWGVGGCHGYAAMVAKYPEQPGVTDDTVREEGTAGHWLAHMLGKGYTVLEGAIAPNKVEIDGDMLEGAELYLTDLRAVGVPVYQEVTLPAPWIHKLCGGTSDAWAWDASTGTLYVWDYKYGYRFVDAFENPQMAIYVSAILNYLQQQGLLILDGNTEQDITVVMTVVQPRGFGAEPVRRWKTKASSLRGLWNMLHAAAIGTQSADPILKAGSHCTDCAARHDCPAFTKAALSCIDYSAKMVPNNLTPAGMGQALRIVRQAKEYLASMESGLEAQLLHAIANGHVDPHWERGHGRSTTVYKEGHEQQVLALASYMKIDGATKPVRAKTPKQLEALMGPAVLAPHIETRPGRRKLIPFTDRSIRKLLS